jgi:hypothetical protein
MIAGINILLPLLSDLQKFGEQQVVTPRISFKLAPENMGASRWCLCLFIPPKLTGTRLALELASTLL